MSEMKHLFWRFWWAGKMFVHPGIYFWSGKNNIRILPWWKQ